MRWDATILEVTPKYCLCCENKVKNIAVSRLLLYDILLVRCVHCNYVLARLSGEAAYQHQHVEKHYGQ